MILRGFLKNLKKLSELPLHRMECKITYCLCIVVFQLLPICHEIGEFVLVGWLDIETRKAMSIL